MTPRVSISQRYLKSSRRLSPSVRKQATRALQKFMDEPRRPGLHFEPIAGRAGFFSIRANLNFCILLQKTKDADGELYIAEDVGPHDIYRRK